MEDKDRITQWINTILHKVSGLDNNKGIEILNACGGECSKTSEFLKGAVKIRIKYKANVDFDTIFAAFKMEYYNNSNFKKEGNKITLIFEECTCPMVKQGVNNSFLCNCTIGYSIKIFVTLFGRPVKVNLIKSILNNDSICKQEILVEDV